MTKGSRTCSLCKAVGSWKIYPNLYDDLDAQEIALCPPCRRQERKDNAYNFEEHMQQEQGAVKAESNAKALRRIRKREERGGDGPWKWQLINALTTCISKLEELIGEVKKLDARNETARKLSEAGKKSAEARRKKFGSAAPGKTAQPVPAPLSDLQYQVTLGTDGSAGNPGADLLGEPVREPVRKPAKKKEPTAGSLVWEAYLTAYQQRHKVAPLRNEKINSQCKQLVQQVGVEEACALVSYYVGRHDAFYLNAKHPLGLLLVDLQKIRTEYLTGNSMTQAQAKREEVNATIDHNLRQLAAQQGVEPHGGA